MYTVVKAVYPVKNNWKCPSCAICGSSSHERPFRLIDFRTKVAMSFMLTVSELANSLLYGQVGQLFIEDSVMPLLSSSV